LNNSYVSKSSSNELKSVLNCHISKNASFLIIPKEAIKLLHNEILFQLLLSFQVGKYEVFFKFKYSLFSKSNNKFFSIFSISQAFVQNLVAQNQ